MSGSDVHVSSIFDLYFHIEPDAPPQNLSGSAVNSTSLFLSWELPPSEQQNGIIRRYLVNVIEIETGNGNELSTTDTHITVSGLHPFYHYECNVSAVTIGAGPYTLPITIQTLQAGIENASVSSLV